MATTEIMNRADEDAVEVAQRKDPATLASLVELDPDQPVADQARLVDSGVAVWAIVNHLGNVAGREIGDKVDAGAIAQTARDYEVPVVEVVAALAFYRKHRSGIDAWRRRTLALHEERAARGRFLAAAQ
jgi:hypothetical protein